MASAAPSQTLDLTGKSITTFIAYEARKRLQSLDQGETLELIADQSDVIAREIEVWCGSAGHEFSQTPAGAGRQRIQVTKGIPRQGEGAYALIISEAGLEQLLSPLAFALAAALEGMHVSIYFQGPAVKVLARGFKPRLSGLARPFSGFALRAMAKQGHIPPQDKLRQLKELGADLYMCAGSMDHFGVKRSDLIFEDLPVIEYLTFMDVMKKATVHAFLQ